MLNWLNKENYYCCTVYIEGKRYKLDMIAKDGVPLERCYIELGCSLKSGGIIPITIKERIANRGANNPVVVDNLKELIEREIEENGSDILNEFHNTTQGSRQLSDEEWDQLNIATLWPDLYKAGKETPESRLVLEKRCWHCGDYMYKVYFSSPAWTWRKKCGRAGYVTFCPKCKIDYFDCNRMN